MNKLLRNSIVCVCALILAAITMMVPLKAAKKIPVKKIYECDFTMSKANIKKAANLPTGKCVVKLGKNSNIYSGYHGYAKFKAKKTKTYTFTFSNLANKNYSSSGYTQIFVTDKKFPKGVTWKKVNTQGGKATNLNIGMTKSTNGPKKDRILKSRYGKLKIKKGETVYIFFSFITGSTLDVNIK